MNKVLEGSDRTELPEGGVAAVTPEPEPLPVPKWWVRRYRRTLTRDIPVENHLVEGRDALNKMFSAMVAIARADEIVTVHAASPSSAVTR